MLEHKCNIDIAIDLEQLKLRLFHCRNTIHTLKHRSMGEPAVASTHEYTNVRRNNGQKEKGRKNEYIDGVRAHLLTCCVCNINVF